MYQPTIIDLIHQHPDLPWVHYGTLANPTITLDFAEQIINGKMGKLDLRWAVTQLSENPVITPNFVNAHLDWPWNWRRLSNNLSITFDFVGQHLDEIWDWFLLSRRHDVTPRLLEQTFNLENVKRQPENKHRVDGIWQSLHFNVTSTRQCNELRRIIWAWDPAGLSCNPNLRLTDKQNPYLTFDFILDHLDMSWDWRALSEHPSVTPEFVDQHLDLPWNWTRVSENSSFTLEFMFDHPDWPWDLIGLSSNPNLTTEFIKSAMTSGTKEHDITSKWENDWHWVSLSRNTSIEFELLHPFDWPWDWFGLSANPRVTPEFIDKHLNFPWHHFGLSFNPNMTPEFITKYRNWDWEWQYLSGERSSNLQKCGNCDQDFHLTIELVMNFIDKKWNWIALSRHLGSKCVTPTFKCELTAAIEERRYRPGGEGYHQAKEEFESNC